MTDRSDLHARRQALSDLMDGAADAGGAARACEGWRGDSGIRGDWYAYHLIGDVLRSEDLAHRPARDEAFLAGLRARLAQEPVVLAPQSLAAEPAEALAGELPMVAAPARRRSLWRRAWTAPSAVAAGFVAVAGVLVVTQTVQLPGPTPQQIAVDGGTAPITLAGSTNPGVQPVSVTTSPVTAASGKLIRDARLDRYLAAHRQYGGSSMLPVPAATSVSYGAVSSVTER